MGGVLGVIKEMFPARPTWEPEHDMPDQTGRVSLVTGGMLSPMWTFVFPP